MTPPPSGLVKHAFFHIFGFWAEKHIIRITTQENENSAL
jgi:hypothetical protein